MSFYVVWGQKSCRLENSDLVTLYILTLASSGPPFRPSVMQSCFPWSVLSGMSGTLELCPELKHHVTRSNQGPYPDHLSDRNLWTKYTDQNQNSESLQCDVIVITLITLVK